MDEYPATLGTIDDPWLDPEARRRAARRAHRRLEKALHRPRHHRIDLHLQGTVSYDQDGESGSASDSDTDLGSENDGEEDARRALAAMTLTCKHRALLDCF